MDCHYLPGGNSALRRLKFYKTLAAAKRRVFRPDEAVAVAHAGVNVARAFNRFINPVCGLQGGAGGVQIRRIGGVEGDDERVCAVVFRHNHIAFTVGIGGHADSLSLANSVVVQAFVPPEDFPRDVYDVSGLFLDIVPQKILNADFPEKTNSL